MEKELPEKYWHCYLKMNYNKDERKNYTIVNDLTFKEINKKIVERWLNSNPFNIGGTIVRNNDNVQEIKITHTKQDSEYFRNQHNQEMRGSGIADLATDRDKIPIDKGEDYTFELLFNNYTSPIESEDLKIIERVCNRLPRTANILKNRKRKDKDPYIIEDEYDVQDLLHGVLRSYIKYSVQENTLNKVANAKSGRADITIKELNTLIEIKYVHTPNDQKRIFEEFSQDLVLYTSWDPLETLIYYIYNSGDLREPEALEKLSGPQEVNGKNFNVKMILV